MPNLTAEQRELLKTLGITDEQIDKKEELKQTVKKTGKKFIPTPKKHIRISLCTFCNTTTITYYILQEEDWCSWVGSEVPKKEYLETKAIRSKPSNVRVQHCDYCFAYIQSKSKEELEDILFRMLNPKIGKIL